MPAVKSVFDPGRQIARRIEKVITYDKTNEELLRQEFTEYVPNSDLVPEVMEKIYGNSSR